MKNNSIKLFALLILTLLSCKTDAEKIETTEMNINQDTVDGLWTNFIQENPSYKNKEKPISFYFCDTKEEADECAELVVKGIKRATATSLWWFEKNNEALPQIGDYYIVTDWNGNAKAVIETTKVEKIPYNQVTAEFAAIEGEGDKSLTYWKKVHQAYYTREMNVHNEAFDENMIIVCEQFKLLYSE